jgi:hypothetical protein
VCPTVAQRADVLEQKAQAQMAAGSSGVLYWNWAPPEPTPNCTYDILPGDPLMATLGTFSCTPSPGQQIEENCRMKGIKDLA